MRLRCCLSVLYAALYAFVPQNSKHPSLPMIRASLSCSFGLYVVYISCCVSEIIASESSSDLIQHACIMFPEYLVTKTAQNFANMFNNSTQCLAAVVTLVSPLSDSRDNQLSFVLGLAQFFFNVRTKTWMSSRYARLCGEYWMRFKIYAAVRACFSVHSAWHSIFHGPRKDISSFTTMVQMDQSKPGTESLWILPLGQTLHS